MTSYKGGLVIIESNLSPISRSHQKFSKDEKLITTYIYYYETNGSNLIPFLHFLVFDIDYLFKDATIGLIEYVSVLFDELEVHG